MATSSDTASRHEQIVSKYEELADLLKSFGYELVADDWEGNVDLDIQTTEGDHLFTLTTIERADY